MNSFLERAQELYETMVEDRRYLHMHAEVGCELPVSSKYIRERLMQIGLEPKEICNSGIVAVIGGKKPGKTILLRADYDALPMEEQSGLPFRSQTSCAHTCGHDVHAAMLLGAAQILKEHEDELDGCVKLMFQPGEEVLQGAKKMIEAGVLEDPKPDAAMAIHTSLDWRPFGIGYGTGHVMASSDNFEIVINGIGCHGATPHMGIDPISTGVHIYQAFMELIARETPAQERACLTFGQFSAGESANIIPQRAVMKGTLRTYSTEVRRKLLERMQEIIEHCGRMYRTEVAMRFIGSVPSLYTDPALVKELSGYIRELDADAVKTEQYCETASEDFAYVAEQIPTAFFVLGCRPRGEAFSHHHPKVVFDEAAMPYGAAVHAQCAVEWLKKNRQNMIE